MNSARAFGRTLVTLAVISPLLAQAPAVSLDPPAPKPAAPAPQTTPRPRLAPALPGQPPSAAPAPAAPAPAPQPSSGMNVLRRDAAPSPTPEATVIPVAGNAVAELQRIRIVRSQTYARDARQAPAQFRQAGPNPVQALTQPGMTLEFGLRPPAGWGILSVTNASLVQVLSQTGVPVKTLMMNTDGASGGQSSWALPVDMTAEEVILQMRTENPPRGDERLTRLAAEFELVVGQRESKRILDIKRKVGEVATIGQRQNQLSIRIDAVEADYVELTAAGNYDQIGAIVITDMNDNVQEPYSEEIKTVESGGQPTMKKWNLAFSKLPPLLAMRVDVYPVRQSVKARIDMQNVALP